MKITIFKFPTFKGIRQWSLVIENERIDMQRFGGTGMPTIRDTIGNRWSFGVETTLTSRLKPIERILRVAPNLINPSKLTRKTVTRKSSSTKKVSGARGKAFKAPESRL